MYNRYIPTHECCTPPAREKSAGPVQGARELLKGLHLDRLDSGDLLLALIVLLLWKENEDTDLLLALGAALFLGRAEE